MPFIYALVDPRTPNKIRYVGMAMQAQRPHNHVNIAKKGVKTRVYDWIRSLLAEGYTPVIAILEECPTDASRKNVGARECYYIEHLRSEGHQLTNVAEGGHGGATRTGMKVPHSAERRVNIGLAQKGRPKFKLRGRVVSAATCMKISSSRKGKGHPHSLETKAKLSAAAIRRWAKARE